MFENNLPKNLINFENNNGKAKYTLSRESNAPYDIELNKRGYEQNE